jgi:hypothetical protein
MLKKCFFAFFLILFFVLLYSCTQSSAGKETVSKKIIYEGYVKFLGESIPIKYEKINGLNVFQGDMVFPDNMIASSPVQSNSFDAISKSVGTNQNLWPNNTVYYKISSSFSSTQTSYIRQAVTNIDNQTNMTFVEGIGSGNYVNIVPDYTGASWSWVGMQGGMQELHLADWANTGTAMHELLHALCMWHEHSRPSRDNYIKIYPENIIDSEEYNFEKKTGTFITEIGGNKFDFDSIMLYPWNAFAIDPSKPTITKLDGSTYTINNSHLSADDITGINYFYPSSTASPYSSIQCRVQRNINDPWDTNKSISLGQSIRIGTMYDGSGYFAADQYITQTVTGPGMNVNPSIGSYITPTQAGSYGVVSKTKDGRLTDSASFTVTGTSSPYNTIQCRVQKDINDPWDTNKSITLGQSIRIGTMHDATGNFADDQYITQTVTGPGMNVNPLIGAYITPTQAGSYGVVSKTKDGRLTDSASFTVTQSTTSPYNSIQCRVQKDINDPWSTSRSIYKGDSIRIGTMHDTTGNFADDQYITQTVTGPGMNAVPLIGTYITPAQTGTFTVVSKTKDGLLTDSASFTVTTASNCPYGSIQCRVQRNITDPWDTNKTISLGQNIRIGSMYDGSGQFADNAYIVQFVTGPGNWKVHPLIGDYITPPSSGTYSVISITTDGRYKDQSTFTVQ